MLKSFILKQMLKLKLKDVPEEQIEKIATVVEKNPDFFMKIAEEIKKKTDSGMDQMQATMEVMKVHEGELKKIVG
jgi:hypothetical protein